MSRFQVFGHNIFPLRNTQKTMKIPEEDATKKSKAQKKKKTKDLKKFNSLLKSLEESPI